MADACDSHCMGCIYNQRFHGLKAGMCAYYFETGRRRPCPPGKGCTVKSTAEKHKNKTWRKMTDAEWQQRKKARMREGICKECGERFQTSSLRQIYCSKKCADKASMRKYKERQERKNNGKT